MSLGQEQAPGGREGPAWGSPPLLTLLSSSCHVLLPAEATGANDLPEREVRCRRRTVAVLGGG